MFYRILITLGILAAVQSQVTIDVSSPYRGTFPGVRIIAPSNKFLSVSGNAGDFNKDGQADIIVGHTYDGGGESHAFIIMSGGLTNVTEIDLAVASSGPNILKIKSNQYAFAFVNGVGDVNGDGYDDVLLSRGVTGIGSVLARNMVLFGKPGPYTDYLLGTTIPAADGFLITGTGSSSIAPLGDVNGDGIDDFIIGDNSGRATMIYGRPPSVPFGTIDTTAIVAGSTVGVAFNLGCCYFGQTVAGPGDVNGDGLNDIVIGRPGGGQSNNGAVYIIHGSRTFPAVFSFASLPGPAGRIIDGTYDQSVGNYVGAAGDVNGDGLPDMIAAAARYVFGDTTSFVQVIYGSSTGVYTIGKILLPAGTRITSVASAGDINQDGYSDIVFCDMWRSQAFIYMGRSTAINADLSTSTNYIKIQGVQSPTEYLGRVSSGGYDVTGDGIPDLIIGASSKKSYPVAGGPLRTDAGAVYVIPGPLHDGPTAAPSARPSAPPTAVPSALPTLAPSAAPSEVPTAAPSFTCEVLVSGKVGETCATTCSTATPARVCDAKIFEKLLTKEAFLDMVSDSEDGLTGQKNGANYCSGGVMNTSSLNGPSALSAIVHGASGPVVRRFCSYATSLTAAQGCEESVPEGLPLVRLCPCTYNHCNEKPWKMSYSGESCSAACARHGSFCDPVQTGAAMDNESFLQALSDSGEGSAVCSAFNAPALSSVFPALLTTTSRGGTNETFCSYPTARSTTVDTCDAVLTELPPVRRLCACGGSRRLLAAENVSKTSSAIDSAVGVVASLRGSLP